ncbi:prohead protease/major capsid protein fusion protein [Chachezhania sediminis]|uniref:prohead protease/major capsid protein fusion protein n=1 Tax=Chachezhania sediminis TaxID=2599291 RepID=UPI00131C17D2|nr:prohead protease/major capsid protein fusion protein [Chachezhania sediminis]
MTIHLRAITPRPTTVDIKGRTVEAIVSTGADAVRPGYIERLDLRGADLSRLVGAPVLDGHRSGSTRDQLGVIEAAELRSEGLWVRMRFRSNDAAQAVLTDIGDGTLRGLSIGYTVAEWQDGRDGKNRVRTATRWTPLEVSIVPVPADAGAHFRNGEFGMEPDEQTAERPNETERQTRAQVNAEIRSIAQTAGLNRAWADGQIDAEVTADAARQSAFAEMQRRSADTTTRTTRAVITHDNTAPEVVAQRAGEALFARSHPDHQISPEARQWAGLTFREIAREVLQMRGAATMAMTGDALITRALHSTSDFPMILGDAVGRELRRSYGAAPSAVRQLARQTTARDFRAKRAIMLGEGPELERVGEGGEFSYGTIDESEESYSAETFGKIFAISRQAMVNDDLGAFTRVPTLLGASSAAFEASQLVAKITANPVMSDGVAVFHEDHDNLSGAYGAPSMTTLSAARLAMRRQTGISDRLIDVKPRFLVVPPELETTAEQVLAEIAATKTDDVNPFSKLSLIVEPRFTDAQQWYLTADPALMDGLEYAYLEGAPGPQIETKAGFEVDGLQIKVRLDFGCGWIEHRGWYRNG